MQQVCLHCHFLGGLLLGYLLSQRHQVRVLLALQVCNQYEGRAECVGQSEGRGLGRAKQRTKVANTPSTRKSTCTWLGMIGTGGVWSAASSTSHRPSPPLSTVLSCTPFFTLLQSPLLCNPPSLPGFKSLEHTSLPLPIARSNRVGPSNALAFIVRAPVVTADFCSVEATAGKGNTRQGDVRK